MAFLQCVSALFDEWLDLPHELALVQLVGLAVPFCLVEVVGDHLKGGRDLVDILEET